MDTYYVFVLASRHHRHLNIGVTADLATGVAARRQQVNRQLRRRRVLQKLVYVETQRGAGAATERYQQLGKLSRGELERLVESVNPCWDSISLAALQSAGFTRRM